MTLSTGVYSEPPSYKVRWRAGEISPRKNETATFPHTAAGREKANRLAEFVRHPKIKQKILKDDPRIVGEIFLHGTYDEKFPVQTFTGPILRDLIQPYFDSRHLAPNTLTTYRDRLDHVLDWLVGPVSAITPKACQQRFRQLVYDGDNPLTPATATHVLKIVWGILHYAVDAGLTEVTLDDGTTTHLWTRYKTALKPYQLIHKSPPPEDCLTEEHYDALLAGCVDPVLRVALRMLAECGLRASELRAVNVSQIKRARAMLVVNARMVPVTRSENDPPNRARGTNEIRMAGYKGSVDAGTPKTRELMLSASLLDEAMTLAGHRKPDEPLLLVGGARITRSFVDDGLDSLQALVERFHPQFAGIAVHPHILRHSFATWAAGEVNPFTLQQMLGHATLRQIEERYYHRVRANDQARQAVDSFEARRLARSAQSVNAGDKEPTSGADDAAVA